MFETEHARNMRKSVQETQNMRNKGQKKINYKHAKVRTRSEMNFQTRESQDRKKNMRKWGRDFRTCESQDMTFEDAKVGTRLSKMRKFGHDKQTRESQGNCAEHANSGTNSIYFILKSLNL